MRWVFFALIVGHGLIHFLGFAVGFGLYNPPRPMQPIAKVWGIAWLWAGLGMLATAALFITGSWRPRWIAGVGMVALSQLVICAAWSDAKFGTVANLLMLGGIGYGLASEGPVSLLAQYGRDVAERLEQSASPPRVVTEADLVRLPEPVKGYLRRAGAVGQPRVRHFKAVWRGRIRAGADDPWMAFTARQLSFPGEPARFFLMKAERSGLPLDVYHAFRNHAASMRVRLLSLVPLVEARGPEVDRAETVTLLNDLCLLAPAEFIDPAIRWEPIDGRSVRAHYTQGAHTVSAVLQFDEAGDLVDFVSDDRLRASADGKQFVQERWSTPVGEYGRFGRWRGPTRGQGRWHPPAGDFTYLEIELLDLEVNGASP